MNLGVIVLNLHAVIMSVVSMCCCWPIFQVWIFGTVL